MWLKVCQFPVEALVSSSVCYLLPLSLHPNSREIEGERRKEGGRKEGRKRERERE
jgi:hypothetical protein